MALAALDDTGSQSVVSRFSPVVAGRLRDEVIEIRCTGLAFDRSEPSPGISAAAVARHAPRVGVVAISVPAPTERFREREQRVVAALRKAAGSPARGP